MTPVATLKIVFAMVLWALCFPVIAAGLEYSPHLTFAAMRAILAGSVLTLLALVLGRPFPRGWRVWMTLAGVGLGATSLGFLGMFHAAEFVSPGLATVIANTQPLLAAVLAAFWLGEKLSFLGSSGLIAGFAGIVLIALPDFLGGGNESYAIGVFYIILAAAGVTLSNVMIKSVAGKVDSLSAMGLQMLLGSIPLVIAALITEEPATINWTLAFIASLLVLALAGSALVYWLWFSALETVPLNRANAFSFLIPVFGLSLGIVIYGERLSLLQTVGIVLIFLGIAMVHHRTGRPRIKG
ncbi:DMT family transporter [Roseovarius nitratireducens]|uniref:DMT family transporter n=1 Tax=Roseovarius nitratireducens TaxID=2044597 RepID=UPI000CE1E733|nr:DMT family transporter [Roseovarius nitratireducens]